MEGNPKASRGNFQSAEHLRQESVAIIQPGLTPEDIERPEYWSTVAPMCKLFGRIEARAEDGTWIAEYLITEVARTFVRVKRLQLYQLTTQDVAITQSTDSDLKVMWRGPHHKWTVMDKQGKTVHSGDDSKSAAESWAKNYAMALTR